MSSVEESTEDHVFLRSFPGILLQLRTDIDKLAISHRSWSKLSKNWYSLEVEV